VGNKKNGAVMADRPVGFMGSHHVDGLQDPSAMAVLGNLSGIAPREGIKQQSHKKVGIECRVFSCVIRIPKAGQALQTWGHDESAISAKN
jgi:hypothetical protein